MGTPSGSFQAGSIVGHCEAGAVNLPFGWAATAPVFAAISGVQRRQRQSMHSGGGSSVMPSHQTPPSGVAATLIKIVLRCKVAMALGLVFSEVPDATPKKPASGLIALSLPSASGRIHAISSPQNRGHSNEVWEESHEIGRIFLGEKRQPLDRARRLPPAIRCTGSSKL